ncbi:MAG: acetyl-CoA carboxylase biotin carboxylase subunit [Gemmatimonadota bacterium]|nr:MAG: acetyl-CoA carboxylase biotin carboxylase subunit [Gemmatimonadota bacterium]
MNRVLVANRGEIALRIIRACHEEGVEAVAVYSEADRLSPHVKAADAAVEIGPAPASESYLSVERLLEAARRTGADAVHPGYGFLAEQAHFAEAAQRAGLAFIGPPASAIRAMGEKTEARRRMAKAGVPIVPGTTEPLPDVEAALRAADEIGFPVLLKAAAGGGGKGMRVAATAGEVRKGFVQAASEARSAFGDEAIYLEKLVERPRHVEIQVLADRFGNTIHLGERECSVQRRHQKLIEESPSTAVDLDLRLRMGEAAVKAAQAVGYLSAGTVEFLLDPAGKFYFLEMNTRLQVEHPITEMVYGVDIVREQLRIAAGEPMTCPNRPMRPRGHAIECRITAEDPFANFLPATGRIDYLHTPSGPGVRWDAGVETGSEIQLYYDSLLGKLITWGETRERAIRRMRRALDELVVVGVPTSQPFHRRVMDEAGFLSGAYDIGYLERVGGELLSPEPSEEELQQIAVAAALAEDEARSAMVPLVENDKAGPSESPWLRVARLRGLR